jgi:predicted  nucleic acid-binding Zn-ribbon protein
MEFSALAEKETSALIARVLAESSHASRQRVDALRAALDAAAKALEAAIGQPPDMQAQVSELVSQLAKVAAAEADTRVKRLSSEARKITDSLRADVDEKAAEKDVLEVSLRDALGHLDTLRAEFNELTRGKDALVGSLAESRARVDAVRAELSIQAQDLSDLASEKDAVASALQEAHAHADALRAELEGEGTQRQALLAELEGESGRRQALLAELEGEAARAQALQQQLDAAYAEQRTLAEALSTATTTQEMDASARAALEHDLRAAHTLIESVQAEAATATSALETELRVAHDLLGAAQNELTHTSGTLEPELRSALELLETARAEAAQANSELQAMAADKASLEHALAEANSQAHAAEAKLAATTTLFKTSSSRLKLLEREREQHEDALQDLTARFEAEGTREVEVELAQAGPGPAVALLDGLLGAFEAMSGAATIGDVLSTLVEQLVNEFPRVALFRVKGNRLEGAHQIGFDLTNDIGKVMMPLAMDSLLTRAVSSGRTERVSGDRTDSSHLPFGGSPTCALAMPIVVDGEPMAVVYADDSGRPESQQANDDLNARFAEALRHHAVALLTRLTSELKAMAELRGYAGSLLSETEQMYEADVAAGKTGDDLLGRLHANLDYARSIYANRVASEPASTSSLLEAQLAGTIDLHRDNAFGRDLAVVMVWESNPKTSRKAEAS